MSATDTQGKQTLEFQAEVKKLLDIVIHSIYTDKEVFVRELVSNASDALEKMRHEALTLDDWFDKHVPLEISIDVNKDAKTITITDTGIGMTGEEMVANLGTIAHSGTKEFLQRLGEAKAQESQLIGQFGVGFYSAFMVAKTVTVQSRSWRQDAQGGEWVSDGSGTYTITHADGIRRGTRIIIELKDDAAEFADADRIRSIIERYSNFVPFPILVDMEKVNTVQALWTRSKSQVKDEEYKEFYKFIANSDDEPLYHLHLSADAPIQLNSVLFCPRDNFERMGFGHTDPGVNLYCRKVLITQHCKDILPDYLRFVKGVVDSEDIPLSISRETMQDSLLMGKLKKFLTKRFLGYLLDESKKDAAKYGEFWKSFAMFIKEGCHTDFENRETLAKLLRFSSSKTEADGVTGLEEYAGRMKEGQTAIYYMSGPSRDAVESSPYLEAFRSRDIEVLYLHDPVDDFVLTNMQEFDGKKLISADLADLELPGEPAKAEEKEEKRLSTEEVTSLTDWMKEVLGDRVSKVEESKRLVDSPAVLVSSLGMMTTTMERYIKASGKEMGFTPPKVLEINSSHPLIRKLAELHRTSKVGADEAMLRDCVEQIADNAFIAAGLLADPKKLVDRMYKIMEQALGR
ncbi:MAG: molecular chaperone HtpG [Nitrospirota bacterium]|nr:molecular chaperone HtpG [Nitrospirota bacterium]